MPTDSPKNILYIFTDQQHRDALGCMGTPDIHTPNLDRLAREGMLFRNAYANAPVCTPFRISLFTGRYNGELGSPRNGAPIPAGYRTLADALNDAGYRTSYVGKWHIGGKGNTAVPEEQRGGFREFLGYQCYNGFIDNVVFYDEQNEAREYDGHRTDVTTDLAIERLEKVAGDRFALFVSYQAPHYPVQPGPEYEAMYRGAAIQRRPNCQEIDPYTPTYSPPSATPVENCPDYQRYGNDLDEYLRLYYAMVTQVDAGVGRILDRLDQLGLREDTVVIFTSDHGDMQGSHGRKNKALPHEESCGIPLIVRAPGGATNSVTDAIVSGIDFYPTCLAYAGVEPPADLPGQNFAPLTYGEAQTLNGPIFAEFKQWKMVRHGRHKLVTDVETFAPQELYDLHADPYEMQNLVEDPAYANERDRLRELIVNWQRDHAPATA